MTILMYLDPGSGSIILQVLLSAVFATLFFFQNSIRRVLGWMRGGFGLGKKGAGKTQTTSADGS